MNFEKSPTGGGARGWIRKSPKSERLLFHFWPINQGKIGELQSKWELIFNYNLLLKTIYPQRKWISKNRRQEVERVAESEIVLNWHVFISIFDR